MGFKSYGRKQGLGRARYALVLPPPFYPGQKQLGVAILCARRLHE
jgi:hypothetical protein